MRHPPPHSTAPIYVQNKPVFLFCIGAQKAGTTWLYSQLERQRDVFLAPPKELHYWDVIRPPYMDGFRIRARQRFSNLSPLPKNPHRILRFFRPHVERHELEKYESIYKNDPYDHTNYLNYVCGAKKDVRLVGDITPAYALLGRDTYTEMLNCHDNVRFVFILRDPVRRLWSGLLQRYRGMLARNSIAETSIQRAFVEACNNPLSPDFLRSDYARTICELEAAVSIDRIHYCFFETLLDADRGQDERLALADFLDIPDFKANIEEKIHGTQKNLALPKDFQTMAGTSLDHVYKFVRKRFGNRVPSGWLAEGKFTYL